MNQVKLDRESNNRGIYEEERRNWGGQLGVFDIFFNCFSLKYFFLFYSNNKKMLEKKYFGL